jgi:dihydroflavonol-4-reductase
MRNVLVTGGTGFLGSNLAHALLREGCHVRILRRSTSDLRAIGNAPVEHVIGDVRDRDSLRRAVKGCDTVFHTAAIVSYWRRERETMYEVNIGGTRNLVDVSLEAGVRRFIHTSSIAAIGFPEDGGLATESNEFNWERYDVGYRISKYRAEHEIQRGVKLGLPAVILNPSIIIGPRDIHFHGGQIVRDVRMKRIFYYVQGGMNIVFVGDVVAGHLAAARQGRIGERYILAGENLTHKEIFTITAEMVGGIRPLFKLPILFVRLIAISAETIGNLFGKRPWVTRELVAGVGMTNYFSSEKAKRELGYTITPFREAIRATYEWYLENGYLN